MQFLQKLWWTVALRAFLLLVFGFIAVTTPLISTETLVTYLGFLLFGMGVIVILTSITFRKSISNFYFVILFSLFDLALAIAILLDSKVAKDWFTIIIAIWAALMALVQLAISFKAGQMRIFLISSGLLSLGFAAVIYFNPFEGNNTLNFVVGFYTILLSISLFYLALKLFQIKKSSISEMKGKQSPPANQS